MTGVPAAVAEPAREHPLAGLQGRLHGFLERSSRPHGARLARRLLPARSDDALLPEEGEFPWLLVAGWLAESFGLASTAAGRRALPDLRWIQYCVYGVFRVQDDLVDGECGDPLLAVEANQLSSEAARCAARHFDGDSPFWDLFQGSIDQTSRALVTLQDLQRSAEREPHGELALYVDLAASLKIGAAGVAFAAGRERDWVERISPALDHLAVAGQILDDVEDVDEDLAEGRINYAAWWLSRPVFGEGHEALRAVVAFNLATGDRLAGLLDVARSQVAAAEEIIGPELCPAVYRFLGLYRRRIDRIESDIERRRSGLFAAA